jgi:protein-disulfide isomerase
MHFKKNTILLVTVMAFTASISILGKNCQEECSKDSAEKEQFEYNEIDLVKVTPKITDNEVSRTSDLKTGKRVDIVVYSDFECYYCAKGFNETISPLLNDNQYNVTYTYKHYPLEAFHPLAKQAALYYEALRLQDVKKAISFHDQLMSQQDELNKEKDLFLDKLVISVKGDMKRLKKDIRRPELTKLIEGHKSEAMKFGIKGTPSYIINGIKVVGHRSIKDIKKIIDKIKS